MISTSRTSDFQISGSAISSHKNIQKSKKIIVPYLKGEKDLQDLADEMCIEKESVKQRTYRIRKQIKETVLPYFADYTSHGTDKKIIRPSYNSNNVEGM